MSAIAWRIEVESERCRDKCQQQGHEDKHREDPLIKDLGLKTDIKNNELDETNESYEH
jgi:hypothetical protein